MKPQTKFTYSAASTKLRKQARRGGLANFVTKTDCRALSQSVALPEMFSIGPSLKSQCSATPELLTTIPIQINRIAFHSRSNKNRTLESARTNHKSHNAKFLRGVFIVPPLGGHLSEVNWLVPYEN